MQDLTLPVTFRKEIVKPMVAALQTGQSCSLIGVGSSGKSNAVRHFNQQEVCEHYLGEAAKSVLNLYVDCAKLTENNARALYCLILEVIEGAAKQAIPEAAVLHSTLTVLWEKAINSEVADLARRNLGQAFDVVFQADITQAFIILDHFDRVIIDIPGTALNSLRAFRDDHKQKIMYVTVTRRELEELRDPDEIEDFFEIVVVNSFAIGPYTEVDARFMIERLAQRETPPRTFSDQERDRLLGLSGRHAGLLRMIYEATWEKSSLMAPDLLNRFRVDPDIQHECEKIWGSLEPDEWETLRALVSQCWPTGDGVNPLLKKGIIWQDRGGVFSIFSPVFTNYVADNMPGGRLLIEFAPEQSIRINNRLTRELNDIEYRLFSYLFSRHPEPTTRKQLIKEMLSAEARQPKTSGSPERRLNAYMEEIKRKIELYNREYIFQMPDDTYRLPPLVDKPLPTGEMESDVVR